MFTLFGLDGLDVGSSWETIRRSESTAAMPESSRGREPAVTTPRRSSGFAQARLSLVSRHAAALAMALAAAAPAHAGGNALKDLPVIASSNGVLDLLMIAKAEPATLLTPIVPKAAMVYEICPRPADGSE